MTPPAGKLNLETLWFTYDGLNRVVIHQGALNNGTIQLVESEYGSARQLNAGMPSGTAPFGTMGDYNAFLLNGTLREGAAAAYQNALGQRLAEGVDWVTANAEAQGVARVALLRQQFDNVMAVVPAFNAFKPAEVAGFGAFAEVMTAAFLSRDVYFTQSIPQLVPAGYRRLTTAAELGAFGLLPERMQDATSGYFSGLYASNRGGMTYYVNRGTDFTHLNDWANNLIQAAGYVSPQYENAIENARAVRSRVDLTDLRFVGHSLGGGLAAAQALVVGGQGITFNAAGLHPNTVSRHGVSLINAGRHVQAISVQDEALTLLQEGGGWRVLDGGLATAQVSHTLNEWMGRGDEMDAYLRLGVAQGEFGRVMTPAMRQAGLSTTEVESLLGDLRGVVKNLPIAAGRRIDIAAVGPLSQFGFDRYGRDGAAYRITPAPVLGQRDRLVSSLAQHGMDHVIGALVNHYPNGFNLDGILNQISIFGGRR